MALKDIVTVALDAAERPILHFCEQELVANKAAIIAQAKQLEAHAIVAIGATIINTLEADAKTPFFSLLSGVLAHAIEASEAPIIAALGGEDEALFALVLHELASIKTA